MTALEDALTALRAADGAGNAEDARRLAGIVDRLSKEQPQTRPMDYVLGTAGGFNRGLAAMVGAPVDLMTAGLNLIPGVDIQEPVGGSQSIREALPESLFPDPPPTTGGRIAARVGEEFGASVIPSAAIMRAGRGIPVATRMGETLWPRVKQAFLDPIRRTPGRAAAGESAAITGAGLGAGYAQEIAPGNKNAELFGQVFGGLTPAALALMPAQIARRMIASVVKRWGSEAARQEGKKLVSEALQGELTGEGERLLMEAERLRREMPGFDPSLGEATGSPALIATQRQIEGAARGGDLEMLAARRGGSEAAVERYAAERAPEAAGGADFVVDVANRRVEDLRGLLDVEDVAIMGRRGELAGRLPRANKGAAGQRIREHIATARAETRARMTDLANKLGINSEDATVPFDAWRKEIIKKYKPKSRFDDPTSLPVALDLIRGVKRGDAPIAFQDIKALRERISDDLLDTIGWANPSGRKVRNLVRLKKDVDNLIDNMAETDVSGRYKEFRDTYKKEYIDPFEKGTFYKVREKDSRGFYKTTDEKVADAFWKAGDTSAGKQFKAVLGADGEANAALEAVALDSLRNATVRDGVIQPNLFETWTRKYASLLDEFPGIRQKIGDIAQADTALISRQVQLNSRRQLVEDQLLTRELNAFSKATKTGAQVIDAAVRDPRKMGQLVGSLKTRPDALSSLRRQVWDRALEGSAADLVNYMEVNAKSLRRLFNSTHFRDLKNIAAARAMHERVPAPTGAGYAPRPFADLERSIGQGIPQIGSRIFAFKSGRMQKGYLVLDTLMRGMRGRAQASAEDLFRVALYDPQVAREMAKAISADILSTKTAKRLQSRWFALAPTVVGENEENGGADRGIPNLR